MTALADYRAAASSRFDELLGDDGTPRPGWSALGLDSVEPTALRSARGHAARLLEDDGVTYNAPGDGPAAEGRERSRWRLDPLPTVVDADDWARLERGVAQRARLLDAVVADLYGPRRLLTSGLVPPELVWRYGGYLRPAWGAHGRAGSPHLMLLATDVGRGAGGSWQVVADRTQAPSGLGYAMENRRVVARLLPDAYRRADLRRLTGFFGRVRDALADLAPPGVEDPNVVVLTPGRHSETAFDQAYIASLLGFPLVTGSDLAMRDGRVWTRDLGGRRPVDVVLRRVDDTWCDPLELRPDSELGVPGLLEASRRGTVGLANALGSGLVESPALPALLPRLCRALLDEPLALPSAHAWWGGDPESLSYVLERLDTLVLRRVGPTRVQGRYGPRMSAAELEHWRALIRREPGAFVGQEVLPLSTTPTVAGFGLAARPMTMRVFSVAHESSYVVMPGALGRVLPEPPDQGSGRPERLALSKDVWVLKTEEARAVPGPPVVLEPLAARRAPVAMVPRAMEDLFWLGRYTERAEDAVRLLLVLRGLADDYPEDSADPGRGAVAVLAEALTHVTGTYPGLADGRPIGDSELATELRAMFTDVARTGTVAQSLDGLAGAASSVRDQLSGDVFLVLGSLERACAGVAERPDAGPTLREAGAQVLAGTLALAGISNENMVRDQGWQLLEMGRGVERALQTAALLRSVLATVHPPGVEAHLVGAVLTAGESVLTHRRRYSGARSVETMLDLMLVDDQNPRSVAFQVGRVRSCFSALPGAEAATRLDQLTAELAAALASTDVRRLAAPDAVLTGAGRAFGEHRPTLAELCATVERTFSDVADAAAEAYFWHPAAPRLLAGSTVASTPVRAAEPGPAAPTAEEALL